MRSRYTFDVKAKITVDGATQDEALAVACQALFDTRPDLFDVQVNGRSVDRWLRWAARFAARRGMPREISGPELMVLAQAGFQVEDGGDEGN